MIPAQHTAEQLPGLGQKGLMPPTLAITNLLGLQSLHLLSEQSSQNAPGHPWC